MSRAYWLHCVLSMITLFLDYKIKVLTSFANKRELNIFSSYFDIFGYRIFCQQQLRPWQLDKEWNKKSKSRLPQAAFHCITTLSQPTTLDTETDACSESNEIPPNLALYSNFIMSFYLARSQSDSGSSENNEIIPTDPLLSKSPTCIIRKDLFEFLMRKSSNSA